MIGVVIPMYVVDDLAASTAREAVESFCQPHCDVIVVQNGGEWVTGMGCDLRVHLPQNLGYTSAVNVGLRTARARGCDHFVVGSADIIAPLGGIEALMGNGIVSAAEIGGEPVTCAHAQRELGGYVCPFWGGVFAFPEKLLDDVGYLPERYPRTSDAAFAARAGLLGWKVERSPVGFEHHHQHSANRVLDGHGGQFNRDHAALTAEFGHDICGLLHTLDIMPATERLATAREYR